MRDLIILERKSFRALRNLGRVVREQSRFKMVFTLVFAFLFLAGLWALFLEGFEFLATLGGMGLMIIHRLFALCFFGLGLLLVLSSIVTSYACFYRSGEMSFLMLQPLRMGQVVFYKFFEAAVFSSWAFFFIIIPFVGAYAWHEELSIYFSFWTLVFSIPFVILCAGLGSLISFVLVRWMPRGRALAVLGLVALAAAVWGTSHLFSAGLAVGEEATLVLTRLIPGLRLASHPLWPSWWVSEGIMAMSRGLWTRGALFWGVLVANLALVLVLVEGVGRKLFYEGWQKVLASDSRRKRRGVLLRPIERMLGFMPRDLRAINMKDLRIFFRDATQWSQGLFFFGLLGLYFLNLRNLRYHTLPLEWRNLIAFLNVFSVSAVLSSFGSRFVYPQLSLEGHSFWILGLSPSSMGRILLAKFIHALVGMMAVSFGLMAICVNMLQVESSIAWLSLGVAGAVSFAVAGLSTGLGACFLDLKQRNTAAIVSGFGGTLNLVLSLSFIILAMLPFAFIFRLDHMGYLGFHAMRRAMALGWVWLLFLTVITTTVPLLLGRRSLLRREY